MNAPLPTAATHQDLETLRTLGAFDDADVEVARRVCEAFGEQRREVLLAAALAVRAPRHGHVCVDLNDVDLRAICLLAVGDDTLDEDIFGTIGDLPDLANWQSILAQSRVVNIEDGDKKPATRRPLVLRGELLYLERYWLYERTLNRLLLSMARQPLTVITASGDAAPLAPESHLREALFGLFGCGDDLLSDRQALSAVVALCSRLTIVSGGPGMGKTWAVRNILTLLWLANGDDEIRAAVVAPSGKAAARLRESLLGGFDEFETRLRSCVAAADADAIVSFIRERVGASTIHRLLGYRPATPTRFRYNVENPLPLDVLVDEASMVDLPMFTRLLAATASNTAVILLGDRDQLSSVEAGSVFADICGTASDNQDLVPQIATEAKRRLGIDVSPSSPFASQLSDVVIRYNRSYRFSSQSGVGALSNAIAVLGDDAAAVTDILANPRYDDVRRIQPTATRQLPSCVASEVVTCFGGIVDELSKSPLRELAVTHERALGQLGDLVLLSPHRHGSLGVSGLCQQVEALLACRIGSDGGRIAPFYIGRPIIVRRNDYEQGLYNGDVGLVVHTSTGKRVVFPGENGLRYFAPARLPEHQTAWAYTIHSAQGSEFGHVIVLLPDTPSPLITRELLYTAVTRATRRVTVVGNRKVWETGLLSRVRRCSGLIRNLVPDTA